MEKKPLSDSTVPRSVESGITSFSFSYEMNIHGTAQQGKYFGPLKIKVLVEPGEKLSQEQRLWLESQLSRRITQGLCA